MTKTDKKRLGVALDAIYKLPQTRKLLRAQLAASVFSGTVGDYSDYSKVTKKRVADALEISDEIIKQAGL